MFIRQTLQGFLDNPMGKGSNAIQSRQLIVHDFETRLKKIQQTGKKIDYTIWIDEETYYIHMLIPTEAPERDNTYDVVLKFTVPKDNPTVVNQRNVQQYELSVFSNSPSFTYTYAYAFNQYEMLVSELTGKFTKATLDQAPMTRNPGIILNYEKTITFAMLYALERHLLDKIVLREKHKKYKKNSFVLSVRNTDKAELEQKVAKRKSLEKKKEANKGARGIHAPKERTPSNLLAVKSSATSKRTTASRPSKTKASSKITRTKSTRKSD